MSLKYIFLCQLFQRTTQRAHLKDTFQGRNKPTQKIHQLCEHSLAIKFLQRRRELLLCRQCGSVQQKQALLQNNKKFKDNKSLRHLIFKPICVKYINSVAMNVRTPMQVASEAKNLLLPLLLLFYTHPKIAQYHGTSQRQNTAYLHFVTPSLPKVKQAHGKTYITKTTSWCLPIFFDGKYKNVSIS